MKKILKDCLTALDGETYTIAKILGCLLTAVFIVLAILSFALRWAFDMVAFGTGAGLVIAATCAAVKITETTEPK